MQIIRECDKCGREQYDSNVGGICDRCGGTWRLATYVKRCPNCGTTFSQHHQFKICPNNCNPSFLVTVPQASAPQDKQNLCPPANEKDSLMSDDKRPTCKACVEFLPAFCLCRFADPWQKLPSPQSPACSEHQTWNQSQRIWMHSPNRGKSAPWKHYKGQRVNIVCLDDVGDSPIWETNRIRGCHWPADGRPRIIDSEDFLWHIDHYYGEFAPSADHYPEYDIALGRWVWRKDDIIRYSYLKREFCTSSGKLWAPNRRIYTFEKQPEPDVTAFRRHSLKPDWHPFPHRNRVWRDNTGQLWEAPTDKARPQYIRCNAEGWSNQWIWIE